MTLKVVTDRLGFRPRRVAEVAAGWPENSNLWDFARDGVPTLLVEPQTRIVAALRDAFCKYPNVQIEHALITPNGEDRKFCHVDDQADAQASFAEGVVAPVLTHGVDSLIAPASEHEARCCKLSDLDPGDIDVLVLDCEGSEWTALETLVSRPSVIYIELIGAYGYVNPDIKTIEQWMEMNGYRSVAHALRDAGQNRLYLAGRYLQ